MWRNAQRAVAYHACRHADREPAAMHARCAGAVAVLGGLVDDLVEGGEHVVCELDLGHGLHALCGGADGEAYEPLLAEGRVEDALCAKVGGEVHGAAEDAAELDVLAEHEDALVGLQSMAECFVDGSVEVYAFGLALADVLWEFGVGEGGPRRVVQEGRGIVFYGAIEACAG